MFDSGAEGARPLRKACRRCALLTPFYAAGLAGGNGFGIHFLLRDKDEVEGLEIHLCDELAAAAASACDAKEEAAVSVRAALNLVGGYPAIDGAC